MKVKTRLFVFGDSCLSLNGAEVNESTKVKSESLGRDCFRAHSTSASMGAATSRINALAAAFVAMAPECSDRGACPLRAATGRCIASYGPEPRCRGSITASLFVYSRRIFHPHYFPGYGANTLAHIYVRYERQFIDPALGEQEPVEWGASSITKGHVWFLRIFIYAHRHPKRNEFGPRMRLAHESEGGPFRTPSERTFKRKCLVYPDGMLHRLTFVLDEVKSCDRYSPDNHSPVFPYYVTGTMHRITPHSIALRRLISLSRILRGSLSGQLSDIHSGLHIGPA